jgi:site-specific recombinase XerC
MTAQLPTIPVESSPWDQALYAFLVEKGNRSGSKRTVESYGRMLWRFFKSTTSDQVTPAVVLSYAHGIGLSGEPPSPVTIGARIACLRSYFRFLIRMRLVTSNPGDLVQRPRQNTAPARHYSVDEIRRIFEVVPDTVPGRRDRAVLLVFSLTGRRRSGVIDLKASDIGIEDGTVDYSYRGKGGKRGRRELPRPAREAISRTLSIAIGAWRRWRRRSRSGRQEQVRRGYREAPSSPVSGDTSLLPVCSRPGYTSCGTAQRSSGAMLGSRSRR